MLKNNRIIPVLIVVVVMLSLMSSLIAFFTDWLFFIETGFSAVFTTTLYAKTGAGLFFGGLLLVFVLVNLSVANRSHFPLSGMYIVGAGSLRLSRDEALRLVKPVSILISFVLALLAANWGAINGKTCCFSRTGWM